MAKQPQQQKHALSDAQAAALARIVAEGGAHVQRRTGDVLERRGLARVPVTRKGYPYSTTRYYVATPAGRRMDEARRAAAQKGAG